MATIVGLLHLKFRIAQATRLKDKRRVLKSFKERLANRNNVSVAEVDYHDNHRMAVLAVAMVAGDRQFVESALQKIVNQAASHRDMILIDHEIAWL